MPEMKMDTAPKMAAKIAEEAGVNPWECYQCGKCSAGCPMAHAMDLLPRQVMRCIQLGDMDTLLKSKSIWLCASCHACVDRCPNSINLPGIMEFSRYEAKHFRLIAVPEVDKFTTIFIENLKHFGRSQEAILEGVYNLTTGNLTQDMSNAPHMLRHGIVSTEIDSVSDKTGVSEMIKRAKEADKRC